MRAARTYQAGAVFLLTSLLLLAGCPQEGQGPAYPAGEQGDVTLYRDIQFEDIPGPPEYVLLVNESHSFQGAVFRTATLHYQGELEWTRAIEFYRSQLPMTGWTYESIERGFDFRILRFRKGPEQLIVVVRQIRNGSRAEIQLDNVERNDLLLKGKLSTR